MIKTVGRVALALAAASLVLSGCKGERTLTVYDLAPDAGSTPGYRAGTPVTLADGSYVTTPDGTKVTTPSVDKVRQSAKSSSNEGDASSTDDTSSAAASTSSTTSTTYLLTTGTTSRSPDASAEFGFPALGSYVFDSKVSQDDGSPGSAGNRYFTLSSPSSEVVRVQETNPSGAPLSAGFYDERHDSDGLWVVASNLSDGLCTWKPKSASLPKKVIDGGSVETSSTCSSDETDLSLTTKVTFKAIRDITIGGRTLHCIEVTRHRVLTDGESTVTSDAVDTFSFELGMRVATSEHTTTTRSGSTSGLTRTLVLVSAPS